jgi:L-cysteine:1D-myo-inositol 2-amino-2-deoxy-alpha-D-glucopyranoside ligase
MLLYSTLTADKRPFAIPTGRPVTLYVCGVTPYDTTHMGHARTYLIFDILIRYLRWQGAEVLYCQNVTDVDDPLFERARRDGVDWRDLAEHQTQRYLEDSAAMNLLTPTYFPRASEEIAQMVTITEDLLRLGHAYEREGNVYFEVKTDPNFGALARLGYDEMLDLASQRGHRRDDPLKRDPLDFVLWQRGEPDDPAWDSPWGPGRPGWHIECSAMSTRYLGNQIDIHGGGSDLIFPHHACEIAQTEPATGLRPFVQIWMHTGMVSLDGEKMSKSRGNLVFVRDALREHHPDTLRWYLLGAHYRQPFDYKQAAVLAAHEQLELFRAACAAHGGSGSALDLSSARIAFDAALADDLDTPLALEVAAEAARATLAAAAEERDTSSARATLTELAAVLGLASCGTVDGL